MDLNKNEIKDEDAISIVVCTHMRSDSAQKSCGGSDSRQLIESLKLLLQKRKLDIPIREQVCFGRCENGIVMRIAPGKEFFTKVTVNTLPKIISAAQSYLKQEN